MRKRLYWIPLLALVLSLSVVGGMLAFAVQAKDKGDLWLETELGDPSALEGVVLTGEIYDRVHTMRYTIDGGQIHTEITPGITLRQFRGNGYSNDPYYPSPSWYWEEKDTYLTISENRDIFWFPPTAKVEELKNVATDTETERYVSRIVKSNQVCPGESIGRERSGSVMILPAFYIEEEPFTVFTINTYNQQTGELLESQLDNNARDWELEKSGKSQEKVCMLDGQVYYITTTNSHYRGYGSICRVERWNTLGSVIVQKDARYESYDPLDLERLRELDEQQGYTRLYNIDLENGNRCIYGMTAWNGQLAVLTYTLEGAQKGNANFALWLFDVEKNAFICKQELGSLPLEGYEAKLFPQPDAITLCFQSQTQLEPALLLSVVLRQEQLVPLEPTKLECPTPFVPTNVKEAYYQNGKTYLCQIIYDLDRTRFDPVNPTYIKPEEPPVLLLSVLEGTELVYTGRMYGDYLEDYQQIDRGYNQPTRWLSKVTFSGKGDGS